MNRTASSVCTIIAVALFFSVSGISSAAEATQTFKRRTVSLLAKGKRVADITLPFDTSANIELDAERTENTSNGDIHASGKVRLYLTLGNMAPISLFADEMILHSKDLDANEMKMMYDLKEMGRSDQSLRLKTTAMTSDDVAQQAVIDKNNMKRLAEIIENYGWPGNRMVGPENARNAFLVLQHADKATQHKYLSVFRNAVKNGDADRADLALLEDRILISDGKPQLYGTQFKVSNSIELYPIQNEGQLEERRRKMGLPPMTEYLEIMRETYKTK